MSLLSTKLIAQDFSAIINNVNIESESTSYQLNADIDYRLSPIVKEALQKGVPLTWILFIKVQQQGRLWNTTLQTKTITYKIQNHALLNLYSVKKTHSKETTEMYSTLTAALDSMSKIRKLELIERDSIASDQHYQLAIKVLFNREALPVPLRPLSYFNSQWALSSDWSLWQLQK